MGKKNLDKLFQEKLKDFAEVPEDRIWQSIETSLDKKKKSRKVIPIWWKLGGVAAILLIAITILNPFQDKPDQTPTVTEVDEGVQKTSEENNANQKFENQNAGENQIVDIEQENISDSNAPSSNEVAVENMDSNQDSKSNQVKKSSKQEKFKNQNALGIQVVNSDGAKVDRVIKHNKTEASENTFDKISGETEVATTVTSEAEIEYKNSVDDSTVKNSGLTKEIDTSTKEGIAANEKEESPVQIEEPKKSIFDEIMEQEQEEITVENSGGKWSAGPSIAPVYYNAIGEGSPVHSIFVPNSKSGDVNLSYGLSVAYEVNKKLSIRSGVHKVDYGYRTNDVQFTSSIENASGAQIDNIDYTLTARSLIVNSKANVSSTEATTQDSFSNLNEASADISATSPARNGVMQQQFGYLEVPVELNYSLLDSKFGINLIGGVSSLFLVDNSISLTSGDLTTEMGEANNVNSVNFSTNVGFGLNYKFTPKVQLNIEPVFKYQLNTFSETDGTFNPFSVGVYSGLSFKF